MRAIRDFSENLHDWHDYDLRSYEVKRTRLCVKRKASNPSATCREKLRGAEEQGLLRRDTYFYDVPCVQPGHPTSVLGCCQGGRVGSQLLTPLDGSLQVWPKRILQSRCISVHLLPSPSLCSAVRTEQPGLLQTHLHFLITSGGTGTSPVSVATRSGCRLQPLHIGAITPRDPAPQSMPGHLLI